MCPARPLAGFLRRFARERCAATGHRRRHPSPNGSAARQCGSFRRRRCAAAAASAHPVLTACHCDRGPRGGEKHRRGCAGLAGDRQPAHARRADGGVAVSVAFGPAATRTAAHSTAQHGTTARVNDARAPCAGPATTSAPRLGSPWSHLHWDWAHPLPRLRRDWAHPLPRLRRDWNWSAVQGARQRSAGDDRPCCRPVQPGTRRLGMGAHLQPRPHAASPTCTDPTYGRGHMQPIPLASYVRSLSDHRAVTSARPTVQRMYRPCHICAATGLTPPTSAPGLGSLL
jgi:hypothetical protein